MYESSNMKRKLILTGVVLVLLVTAAVVILPLVFIDPLIKAAIEKTSPVVAKVETKLDRADVSILSGKGTLKGLVVGNPDGFKTPYCLKASEITLAVNPGSLMSDKVVIRQIRLISPEIAFEGGLKENNLTKIHDNVLAFTGGFSTNASDPSKKLQVDEFVVSGAKVTATTFLAGGQPVVLNLPDIRLTGLGTGPEGITAGNLMAVLLNEISSQTMAAIGPELSRLGASVVNTAVDNAVKDAQKKLGGLLADPFKKQK